jgi:hypothetical protein
MPPNFLAYKAEHLLKVNSQRRAMSLPTSFDVPVLTKGEVQYFPEAKMEHQPATCYNCPHFNYGRSCELIGPEIAIRKFIYPEKATSDAKRIEYWPCCSAWLRGEPNYGSEHFHEVRYGAESLGLGWINSPRVGQEIGGANCGGKNGGDDCDHYCTEGDDKRAEPTAFCRVLQDQVENGAVCSAWRDDDWLPWQSAEDLLEELCSTEG